MRAEDMVQTEDTAFNISPEVINTDEAVNILNHSNTFAIFDRWGNIHPHGKMIQGIYHNGTRFLNKLVLSINKQKPLLLSSAIKEDNDILSVDLTNPYLEGCDIPENTVHVSRNQFIREGCYHEEITCIQFSGKTCWFDLSLVFDGDFKDIFEIRGIQREVPVNKVSRNGSGRCCSIKYEGKDGIDRQTVCTFNSDLEFVRKNNSVTFHVKLNSNEVSAISYSISFLMGEGATPETNYQVAKKSIQTELENNRSMFAVVLTSNHHFNHWLKRSQADLVSLLAMTDLGQYPYAGVPWYNTPFGRDGIITAMETLWLAPEISRDVLLFLASKQATRVIPEKDAEPGKILHEARSGEMANTGEVPFKEYYGTTDATPLFVMLAGMYYERTNDTKLLKKLWPNIKAAIAWINDYGDIDGDGFVEYQHKARNGLTNQGWKDSFDSVMHEDGDLAEPPIALSEVQGYVYGAKTHAAKMAVAMGENDFADQMSSEARDLKMRFNESFWDDSIECFILALDGNKQPCKVVSSNPGHCLFTGIVDDNKARKLADTLLSKEMFSGWGIRTLSANEKRYNPMSYHNGSVWPHDNALIAYGLSLYGFQEHVLKVMEVLFDASLSIHMQRLPELYCGFERRSGEGPTAYPVACSPQAWSVAVVFMLLQACFKIEINAVTKTITFNQPALPQYLDEIYITNLTLTGQECSLRMKRMENDVSMNLLQKPQGWKILILK
jgi:glycogen debranching enzyme